MGVNNPLVSVLIPAFNRVRLIDETVDSVLKQTYSPVELIVVDDGSTDGTYEKLLEYASRGILTLRTHGRRENKGQSAALNVALSYAKGDYVAILDSDDLFLPHKLEKQVAFLEARHEVGLVYGMGEAIDEEGNWLYDILSPSHQEPNDPNAVLLNCYFLLPQNALVRSSVFKEAGLFEESFRAAQDHDMLIRIAEITRFAFIPEKVFQYRRHGDSISNRSAERRWKTGFEILRRAGARYPYRRSTLRKRAAVLNFRLAQTYWREGQLLRAIPYILRCGFLDPTRAVAVITGRESVR